MDEEIDFEAIYNDIDRKEFIEKLIKKTILWTIGIAYTIYLIAVFSGYIDLPSRCGYDERAQDYVCWDPRG